MPSVARSQGADAVLSLTGAGRTRRRCPSPLETATNVGSSNVFVNGIGVVRGGDLVAPHRARGCGPDTSTLTASTAASKVFANGNPVAYIGSRYTADNIITSGSRNVFVGR